MQYIYSQSSTMQYTCIYSQPPTMQYTVYMYMCISIYSQPPTIKYTCVYTCIYSAVLAYLDETFLESDLLGLGCGLEQVLEWVSKSRILLVVCVCVCMCVFPRRCSPAIVHVHDNHTQTTGIHVIPAQKHKKFSISSGKSLSEKWQNPYTTSIGLYLAFWNSRKNKAASQGDHISQGHTSHTHKWCISTL